MRWGGWRGQWVERAEVQAGLWPPSSLGTVPADWQGMAAQATAEIAKGFLPHAAWATEFGCSNYNTNLQACVRALDSRAAVLEAGKEHKWSAGAPPPVKGAASAGRAHGGACTGRPNCLFP